MSSSSVPSPALFGLTLTVSTVLALLLWKTHNKSQHKEEKKSFNEQLYYPPLPHTIVEMLRMSRLCFLATQNDGEPHLSLMNFTYHQEEEVIILCTRRNTKKYCQIVSNPKVAVLIHDFPHLNYGDDAATVTASHGKSWSITLNGVCEVFEVGSKVAEKYRLIHLQNNQDYAQFITGDDIGVIVVRIEKARMCDIHDRVSYWNSKEGFVPSER